MGLRVEKFSVAVVFQFRFGFGVVGGDFSGVFEEFAAGEFEEVVELGDPLSHRHEDTIHGLELGEFEVGADDAVEGVEFGFVEIIFGDGDIVFPDDAAGARGFEAHLGLGGVCAEVDDFGGGVAVGCPVHFVLDGGEELLGVFGVGGVVDAGGVDVEDFLVEAALGGADVADAFEEFSEVIFLAGAGRIFEAFVVHGEALHQVLGEACGGPLAELCAAMAADAVANGEDGGEGVVFDLTGDRSLTFGLNYPEFPDSCRSGEFGFFVNVAEMFVYGFDRDIEQISDEFLGEPKGFVFEAALDARAAVFGLVEEEG